MNVMWCSWVWLTTHFSDPEYVIHTPCLDTQSDHSFLAAPLFSPFAVHVLRRTWRHFRPWHDVRFRFELLLSLSLFHSVLSPSVGIQSCWKVSICFSNERTNSHWQFRCEIPLVSLSLCLCTEHRTSPCRRCEIEVSAVRKVYLAYYRRFFRQKFDFMEQKALLDRGLDWG
jgi:hypothetical protein